MSFTSNPGSPRTWRQMVNLFNQGLVTADEADFIHGARPLEGFIEPSMTPGEALIKSIGAKGRPIVPSNLALPPGPRMLALPPGQMGPSYSAPFAQGPIKPSMVPGGTGVRSNPLAGIASDLAPPTRIQGSIKGAGAGTTVAPRASYKSAFDSIKSRLGKDVVKGAAGSADETASGVAKFFTQGGGKGLKAGLKGGLYGYGAQKLADAVVDTESGSWQDFVKDVGVSTGVGAAVGGGIPGAAIGATVGVGGWLLEKVMSDREKEDAQKASEAGEDPTVQTTNDLITLGERTNTDPSLLQQVVARYQVSVAGISPTDEEGNERSEEDLAIEFDRYRSDALDTLAQVAGYNESSMQQDTMMAPQLSPQEFDNIMAIQMRYAQPYIDTVRQDPYALATMMSSMQAMPYMVMQDQAKMMSQNKTTPPKTPRLSDFIGKGK